MSFEERRAGRAYSQVILARAMVKGIGVDLGVNKVDKVHAGDTIKVRGRFF